MLADVYDAINQNTRACGNFKKPPKIEPRKRPGRKKKDKKGVSLKDIYTRFQGV